MWAVAFQLEGEHGGNVVVDDQFTFPLDCLPEKAQDFSTGSWVGVELRGPHQAPVFVS